MSRLGPRIAIIGNAGGGKSTLARRLGQTLELPVIHVDSVQYQSGWQRTEDSECDRILDAAAKAESWVIDGFGNDDVIKRRIALADTLVLIDFPLWRHYWWALKRQWSARHGQRSELPANCPEFSLVHTLRLFAIMWRVYREYTPWFRSLTQQKAAKGQVVVIRHPAQWDRLANVESLETRFSGNGYTGGANDEIASDDR